MTENTLPVTDPATVEVDDRDGVRLITLSRPKALNAFSVAMFDAVSDALAQAAVSPEIRCAAITATGRAFSAGSDLADDGDALPRPRTIDPYEGFISTIENFPKPLVAAVNGLAVGIGTSMLGHCDLVLAGRSARFRLPFTSLGLVPEAGSTITLPALMGRQRANHAFLTSNWISAQEALESGLVWRLTDDDQLLSETLVVCAEIAAKPLESLTSTKRLLLQARLPQAHAARMHEEPEFRRLLTRPAHLEAVAAFRDRREPDFRSLPEG